MYIHSKVADNDRLENENYNQQYYLGKQYEHWKTWSYDEILNEDSTPFQVAWLQNIKRLINLFYYDESLYSLIDVGCGSGISTLYFAENSKFKTYSGFDFSDRLINEAKKNYQTFKNSSDKEVDFFVADAKQVDLPKTPSVLFLFNPFGWSTLKVFIDNHLQSLIETKSVLAYANDLYINEISETYVNVKIVRDNYYNLSLVYF